MTNEYSNTTVSAEEVYLWMSQTDVADDVRKSLIFLAEESNKGLSADECAQLADQILFAVGRYELLLEKVESDAAGAMRQFLDSLNILDMKERMDIMSQLFFGLRCAEDDRLFRMISAESEEGALYRRMQDAPDYIPLRRKNSETG